MPLILYILTPLREASWPHYGGCRFPGCTHTRFTEGHHIVHWAHGGETKLENLITLCHFHHHLVHEDGDGVERIKTGEFRFTRPDGRPLDDHYLVDECFSGNILGERNEKRGIRIGPDTIASRWSGETMDYNIAIGVLLAARERERRADAPERSARPPDRSADRQTR